MSRAETWEELAAEVAAERAGQAVPVARPVVAGIHGHTEAEILARCVWDGDCLVWQGARYTNGAPRLSVIGGGGRTVSARRALLELRGHDLAGRVAYSTCGNPLCMAHLVPATMRRVAKETDERTGYTRAAGRRAKIAAVKRARHSPLTPDQVEDIRFGPGTVAVKAVRHGVSEQTVSQIRAGRRWRDYSSPWAQLGG